MQIGAPDMALPRMNNWSFWILPFAFTLLLMTLFLDGGAPAGGWTLYPPLVLQTGAAFPFAVFAVHLMGLSSIMGAINVIATILNMRAPGMTLLKMPLFVWTWLITAYLLIAVMPVLAGAITMTLTDRHFGTTFFNPAGGGDPVMFQHIFWFFGHPEVYIMILPAMGITSEILPVFSRKPIFGYRAMAYSIMGIAGLGFIVWGHHMFQSGMNPTLGTSFMMSTMLIAVPSAIKTFNWLGTLWRGTIHFTTAMLNAMAFVSMFIIGGLSGVFMASTPVDIFIHDTYFIVAHLHYVLFGGSMFGIFASVHYWFPKMFGRMMSERWGKVHFVLTFIAYNLTFFPMHILGMGGMMRRIYDPTQYDFLKPWQPMNIFVSMSAFTLGLVQVIFMLNFLISLFRGKKVDRNPWHANSLEWTAPSPPGHGNFETIPTVYRGPYEFSSPESKEDYLPQNVPSALPAGAPAGVH
jgi:cytochrome c oxidase subunit 1